MPKVNRLNFENPSRRNLRTIEITTLGDEVWLEIDQLDQRASAILTVEEARTLSRMLVEMADAAGGVQ